MLHTKRLVHASRLGKLHRALFGARLALIACALPSLIAAQRLPFLAEVLLSNQNSHHVAGCGLPNRPDACGTAAPAPVCSCPPPCSRNQAAATGAAAAAAARVLPRQRHQQRGGAAAGPVLDGAGSGGRAAAQVRVDKLWTDAGGGLRPRCLPTSLPILAHFGRAGSWWQQRAACRWARARSSTSSCSCPP